MPEITISTPIFAKETGRPIGVIVNYILISEVNKLLIGEHVKELGAISWGKGKGAWKTMEVYLVNRDKLMITKSIFVEDAVLKQIVDTLPVNLCLTSGEEMAGFYKDYRGVEVVGASMYIPSMKWVLLVEIDKSGGACAYTICTHKCVNNCGRCYCNDCLALCCFHKKNGKTSPENI